MRSSLGERRVAGFEGLNNGRGRDGSPSDARLRRYRFSPYAEGGTGIEPEAASVTLVWRLDLNRRNANTRSANTRSAKPSLPTPRPSFSRPIDGQSLCLDVPSLRVAYQCLRSVISSTCESSAACRDLLKVSCTSDPVPSSVEHDDQNRKHLET